MTKMNDSIGMMAKSRQSVSNPWSHAAGMLISGKDVTAQWAEKNYGRIVGAQAMLSNIGPGVLMRLYQNDVFYLTSGYELAVRDPDFRPTFELMMNSWEGELKMTRANAGKERDDQKQAGGAQQTLGFEGYGADMDYAPEEGQGGLAGIKEQLFGAGGKKKRQPPQGL